MSANEIHQSILELQLRWDKIRVANLFDALDTMGYPDQCVDHGIRPLLPSQHLAGKAVTVRGVKAPLTKSELHEYKKILDFPDVDKLIYGGSVVVVESGGEFTTGKFGEMTSWSHKQKGAKGIVIDGFIRDFLGLLEIPDYTVCVRGTSPIESDKRWRIQEVNSVIALPGTLTNQVRVSPGDWIVGDADGIIIVPQQIALEALERSESIETKEQGMRKDLINGVSFEDAFQKWGRS